MTTTATPDAAVPSRPGRRRRAVATAAAVAVVATGGFVYESRIGTPSTGPSRVDVAAVAGVGEVLVDGQGKVLYLFEPDQAASVTCTGGCAEKWPPLVAPDGELPSGAGVRPDLLGTAAGEGGLPVVTYAGWPLYRYASDDPGQATGHDKDQNGGLWFAVTSAGERVR